MGQPNAKYLSVLFRGAIEGGRRLCSKCAEIRAKDTARIRSKIAELSTYCRKRFPTCIISQSEDFAPFFACIGVSDADVTAARQVVWLSTLQKYVFVIRDRVVHPVRYPVINSVEEGNDIIFKDLVRHAPGALIGNNGTHITVFHSSSADLNGFLAITRRDIISDMVTNDKCILDQLMQVVSEKWSSFMPCSAHDVALNAHRVRLTCKPYDEDEWSDLFVNTSEYTVHMVNKDGSSMNFNSPFFKPQNGNGNMSSCVTSYICDSSGVIYLTTTAHDISKVTSASFGIDDAEAPALSPLLLMGKSQLYCTTDQEMCQFMAKYDSKIMYLRAMDPSVLYKNSVSNIVADVAIFGIEYEELCSRVDFTNLNYIFRGSGPRNRSTLPMWDEFAVQVYSAPFATGKRLTIMVSGFVDASFYNSVHEILYFGYVYVGQEGFMEAVGEHSGLGLYDRHGSLHSAIKGGSPVGDDGRQLIFLTPAAFILDQAKLLLSDDDVSFVKRL